MDNFTQDEKDIEQVSAPLTLGAQEGEDIEFDEDIDIEDIQKILQKHMDESAAQEAMANAAAEAEVQENIETATGENKTEKNESSAEEAYNYDEDDDEDGESASDAPNIENDEIFSQIALQVSKEQAVKVEVPAKKYVIYIEPENIEFIEQLSIAERKEIINKILAEQGILAKKRKREAEIAQYLKHAIVVTLTLLIGFPLLFTIVNRSLELTVANYERAQRNFGSLYREQGKIQRQNASEHEKY